MSVLNPEEEFGTNENEFSTTKNSSVLWQAVVELDTLYYPTATSHFQVMNFNNFLYLAIAKLQLNVVTITINDYFTFQVCNLLALWLWYTFVVECKLSKSSGPLEGMASKGAMVWIKKTNPKTKKKIEILFTSLFPPTSMQSAMG